MIHQCSVIIPVFNSERFIEKALESVINQTFNDFELIAIDDCSEDSSYEIMQKIAETDSRIRIFKNEKNCGVAKTRNRGIELAQGSYIALLDSDDIWLPKKLEIQMEFIKRKKCSLSYCSYGYIDKDDNVIGGVFCAPPCIDMSFLLKKNVISCSTVIAERELFLRHEFNSEYYHEDYVAWIGMMEECKRSYGVTGELAKIRIMQGTRSGNKVNSAKQRWLIYREHLGMGVPKALYYYFNYAFFCVLKYRNLRKELN